MINVSPIGRNVTHVERNDYKRYDEEHKIRERFVEELKSKFGDFGLRYVYLNVTISKP